MVVAEHEQLVDVRQPDRAWPSDVAGLRRQRIGAKPDGVRRAGRGGKRNGAPEAAGPRHAKLTTSAIGVVPMCDAVFCGAHCEYDRGVLEFHAGFDEREPPRVWYGSRAGGTFVYDLPFAPKLRRRHRVAPRVAINHHRSLARRLKRWVFFGDLQSVHEDGSVQEFEPADPLGVFDREAMLDLSKHVNRLPDEFRMPLIMLAVDGLTIPEIAAILEIPEGTVKSRIFYARKRLKERLQKKKRHK